MADITMCNGVLDTNNVGVKESQPCPFRDECYRFTAPINEYRQAWFMTTPGYIKRKEVQCNYFWNNKER